MIILEFLSQGFLSGKSTIAPVIGATIADSTLQNMDIIRLTAQMMEEQKPISEKSPFINFGSCDAYKAIGDGSYSPEKLVEGYVKYSEIVSSALFFILPKLETQGAKNVVFEGVQLTPDIVERHLNKSSRLIVVTSSFDQLTLNARKMFGGEKWLLDRYSPDKLILLQEEILRQADNFSKDKLLVVDNSGEVLQSEHNIIDFLISSKAIELKNT